MLDTETYRGTNVKNTRVCLLDSGTIALPDYKLFWGRGNGELIRFAAYCVLVDHADGLFLFDTGYDKSMMDVWTPQDDAISTEEQQVLPQLAKLGIKPTDVDCIINSHFHIDHVGGNKHFPGATVVVNKKEYDQAVDPMPFEYQSYSDLSFDPELHKLNFQGKRDILRRAGMPEEVNCPVEKSPTYKFLDGDTEILKGVYLYDVPGHSAGQMAMIIELAGRKPMFFPADACHLPRHLEDMIVPGFHVDPVAGYRSLERVRALRDQHDAEIFWGHPPGDSLVYKHAPEWYA
jgi:4-pyridoxolactonase